MVLNAFTVQEYRDRPLVWADFLISCFPFFVVFSDTKNSCSVQQKDGKTLPNTAKSMEEKITEGNTYCSRGNFYLMRGDFKNPKECYDLLLPKSYFICGHM